MPDTLVLKREELEYVFEERLTYSILRIDQGIDGLVFTTYLPCTADIAYTEENKDD